MFAIFFFLVLHAAAFKCRSSRSFLLLKSKSYDEAIERAQDILGKDMNSEAVSKAAFALMEIENEKQIALALMEKEKDHLREIALADKDRQCIAAFYKEQLSSVVQR